MLLMSASEAASVIGAKCGSGAVTSDDPVLLSVLDFITSRVEEALNVQSLVRGAHTDKFVLPAMSVAQQLARTNRMLRLSNGFLAQDSLTLLDPNGEVVEFDDRGGVEHAYGIVNLPRWIEGVYTAEYVSGFEPEEIPASPPTGYDPDKRVLQNVPAWMKGIVANYLVLWFKTTQLQPKVSKDLSYTGVLNGLRREVYAWVYGKYQRPRVGCVFPAYL